MKLLGLRVADFRRFVRPVALEGLGPGLNVLVAPNETGKSTLLDAMRAALFERHGSTGATVKDLQTEGNDTAPKVSLSFELADGAWRIEKQFLKGRRARLERPDGSVIEGEDAEAELQRLLGFDASRARDRSEQDKAYGAWSLLWVRQGASFEAPAMHDTARDTLRTALEAEVGQLAGGRRGRDLSAAIGAAVDALLTKDQRRPTGDYRKAIEAADEAAKRAVELRAQLDTLRADLDRFADCERKLAEARRDAHDPAPKTELAQAKEKREALERRALALDDSRRLHGLLDAKRAAAEEAVARRRAEAGEVEERARKTARLADELGPLADAAARADATVAAAQAAVEKARAKAVAAEAEAARLGAIARLAALADEIAGAEGNLANAVKRQSELERLSAELGALPEIERKAVDTLRRAEREAAEAAARLDAASTRVRLDVLAPALPRLRVDGAPLAAPLSERLVRHDLRIEIEGVGSVEVRPGGAGTEPLEAAARAAADRLAALRGKIGLDSADRAQEVLDQRLELGRSMDSLRQQIAIFAGGDPRVGLAPGIDALRTDIAHRRAVLAAKAAATDHDPAGPFVSDDTARTTASAALAAARDALGEAESALERARRARDQATTKAAESRANHAAARDAAEKAVAALARAEGERPLAGLDAEAETAAREAAQQARSVEDEERAAAAESDTPELVDARIRRLEAAIGGAERRAIDLDKERAGLALAIDRAEGVGLGERTADADVAAAAADARRAGLEREAASLLLLRDTLAQAASEAEERYLAPVSQRIVRYLKLLFPGAEPVVDGSFGLVGLKRGGAEAEDVDKLSAGTREQLAILVRLAFADMLVDRGVPAVVVLDDVLAFADDARLERLFDVINLAAEKLQIVVLSCHERAFARLGGRPLRLVEAA